MKEIKSNLQIDIFGNTYNIKGVGDLEYLKRVSKYIDQKMREISSKTSGHVSTAKIAVLSALNIADELFSLKKEAEKKEEFVNKKTTHMLELIEKEI